MKTIKYLLSTFAVLFLLTNTSCKKEFYTDANVNPNTPPAVVPYVILSTVEGALGYTQSSTHCFFTALFMQQGNGLYRQAAAYNQYIVTGQDLDDPWGNWYTSVMQNDKQLMLLADSRSDSTYSGISRIIMAFAMQQVVDAWGSVPYSQAFLGLNQSNMGLDPAHLHPTYDNDATLYGTIGGLVDAGIIFLNNANPGIDKPSTHGEDVIYGGSETQWIKFGHAIKARLAIHQSKNNAAMATTALTEVAASFTGTADNAQYPFGVASTANNARYQYNSNRADIDWPSSTLATMMGANSDPRYQSVFDSTYNDANGVGMGGFYGNPDAAAEFITYEELAYITAEGILRSTGNFANAQLAFQAGIQASMDKFGISGASATAYIAAHGTLPTTSVADAISAVAYESWVSNFLNPEAWTTWRRTNSPALTPVVGNQIPRRFLYTQTEYTFNGSNTPQSTLYAPKLFWDN